MSTRRQVGVSVALPVHGGDGGAAAMLERAARCILTQTLKELDVMIVLNGAGPQLHATARAIAFSDARVRILERREANLASALNAALEAARYDIVARMDADDLCPPHRLEAQLALMNDSPDLVAAGCAWELLGPDGDGGECGRVITTVRPPTDPGMLRWRLLLGNCLAHGSMMLRRRAVLEAGGYNPRCHRAQDYELWLRLITMGGGSGPNRGGIGCHGEVLYQHRTRYPDDPGRSTAEQASVAAPIMIEAWRSLPPLDEARESALVEAVTVALRRSDGSSLAALESVLAAGPSTEALLAWLWAQWHHPPMHRRAAEICRLSRVREIGAAMRAAGARGAWIWGAGDHTRWLLEHRESLGMPVLGLVDDRAAPGSAGGFDIHSPDSLAAGDHALISSDWHEEAIWASSLPHRGRGVHVWRLYG
jgi:hypothetical protein